MFRNQVTPEQSLMMQLFPEVYACVGCAACTKALHVLEQKEALLKAEPDEQA